MAKKLRGEIAIKSGMFSRKVKIKVRFIAAALVMMVTGALGPAKQTRADAANDCPDVKIVFARGSGGERWTDQNFTSFRDALLEELTETTLTYAIEDLDYPAVGLNSLTVLAGAYVGAGESYEFGKSVQTGVDNLVQMVNNTCPDTKFVVAGYSQGAIVVSKALPELMADKVLYAATFGDPKLYLPEGKGLYPDACRGINFSDYRKYVPDCYAYEGLLGGYRPYEPEGFYGKVGTWCNSYDIFCSSYLSINSHTSYVSDNLYADAAVKVAEKVRELASAEPKPMRETVIVVDDSWFMRENIDQYRARVLEAVDATFESGGKVAFYTYTTDAVGNAVTKRYCDFSYCTAENVREYLNDMQLYGSRTIIGYDAEHNKAICYNAGLDAVLNVLSNTPWSAAAEKSVVLATDGGLVFEPFNDDGSLDFTVTMGLELEVKVYVVTEEKVRESGAEELAARTGGKMIAVTKSTGKLMAARMTTTRGANNTNVELPALEILDVTIDGDVATITFVSSGGKAIVILNGATLGIVEGDKITIGELDFTSENVVRIVAASDSRRGEAEEITLNALGRGNDNENAAPIPKTPDTGIVKSAK